MFCNETQQSRVPCALFTSLFKSASAINLECENSRKLLLANVLIDDVMLNIACVIHSCKVSLPKLSNWNKRNYANQMKEVKRVTRTLKDAVSIVAGIYGKSRSIGTVKGKWITRGFWKKNLAIL